MTVQGSDDVIDDLTLSPDGRTLAAVGFRRPQSLVGRAIWFAQGHVAPASNWRATRATVLVDFPSGRPLARAAGAVQPVFSLDGRRVALRGWDSVTIRPVPAVPPDQP